MYTGAQLSPGAGQVLEPCEKSKMMLPDAHGAPRHHSPLLRSCQVSAPSGEGRAGAEHTGGP